MRLPVGAAVIAVVLTVTALAASAQSRRVIDYFYDDAGNLIRIEPSVSENPPDVQNLSPANVRIGPAVTVTATGADLRLVEVQAVDATITISNVASTPTTVTFDVQATESTPLGPTDIVFTTRLGSTTRQLTIEPRLPVLFVSPAPVAVGVGQVLTLGVELSNIDIIDHTIELSVDDSAVATVSPASVTVLAGEVTAAVTIVVTGQALGSTVLNLSSATLPDVSVNVFVTEIFVPPVGDNAVFAPNVGIFRVPAPDPPSLITIGPFRAEITVEKQPDAEAPAEFDVGVAGPLVGVTVGNAVSGIDPSRFIAGAGAATATVSGSGLDEVTSVTVIPADDVTVNDFSASPDGQSASLTLTVAQGATLGQRTVVFDASGARLPAASPGADRIQIASGVPRVESVTPSVMKLDSSATLIIRGRNLQDVQSVEVAPLGGVTLGGPPLANASGTEVSIGVSVPETAQLGDRIVTVTTGAGTSEATPSSANTLRIVNGPITSFDFIPSQDVLVVKGEPAAPPVTVDPVVAPVIGVTFGSVITGLDPPSGIIGTTVTLEIQGAGLENVNDVQFIPEDGLTIGTPVAAADGSSVSVDVSIAPDAPQTLREVRLFDGGFGVPASGPLANRFQITAPQPRLRSVSPNFVITGEPAVEIMLFGENFEDASVAVLPPEDISVGPPAVTADGRVVTLNISAAAGATPGDRVIVVTTPAGATPSLAGPENTLTVATQVVQTVSPVVAPLVGVVKSVDGAPGSADRLIVAPIIGVEKTPAPPPADTTDFDFVSSNVGVAVGPVAVRTFPAAVPVGSSVVLVIEGFGLNGVDSVEILPADGVTVDGPVVAVSDEVQVPITVTSTAPLTVRELVLRSAGVRIPFSSIDGNRIKIAAGAPEILSIEPIQEVPGARFTLIIRGNNLGDASNVFAEPPDGVNLGTNITPNADGTEITVDMSVDSGAVVGPRVIRVDTPAGATSNVPSSANTFSVVIQ